MKAQVLRLREFPWHSWSGWTFFLLDFLQILLFSLGPLNYKHCCHYAEFVLGFTLHTASLGPLDPHIALGQVLLCPRAWTRQPNPDCLHVMRRSFLFFMIS